MPKAKSKKTPPKAASKSKNIKKSVKKVAPKKVASKKTARPVVKATKKPTKKLRVKKAIKKITTKPVAPPASATPAPLVLKSTVTKDLSVGSKAPHFVMPSTLTGEVSSETLKGKIFILYFYPKDDTSGCTAEACEFRNTLPDFNQLGVTIIGVSKDNLESHEKFSRKYNLNFPLASDQNSTVCESFGTWVSKSMYGRSYMGIERSTFLIDGEGTVRALWRKVSVPGHVEEVRKAVNSL